MREIKFRLWDGKRFHYWGYLKEGISKNLVFTSPPQLGTPLTQEEMRDRSKQFTGLKDKNGKEIYEGDIIQWSHKSWDVSAVKRAVINWDYIGWAVDGVKSFNRDAIDSFGVDFSKCNIIGNIYENPELLGKIEPEKEKAK